MWNEADIGMAKIRKGKMPDSKQNMQSCILIKAVISDSSGLSGRMALTVVSPVPHRGHLDRNQLWALWLYT